MKPQEKTGDIVIVARVQASLAAIGQYGGQSDRNPSYVKNYVGSILRSIFLS